MTVLTVGTTDEHLGELVRVLWRQRALIETLQYRLEVQQLITATGRDTRLQIAVDEVEAAMDELRRAERQRDDIVRRCGLEMGLAANASLSDIRERSSEPWASLLAEHQSALLSMVAEAEQLANQNRELALRGVNSTRALLDAVTGNESAMSYGPAGPRAALLPPALLDRDA